MSATTGTLATACGDTDNSRDAGNSAGTSNSNGMDANRNARMSVAIRPLPQAATPTKEPKVDFLRILKNNLTIFN
jgi:hypothetical protein